MNSRLPATSYTLTPSGRRSAGRLIDRVRGGRARWPAGGGAGIVDDSRRSSAARRRPPLAPAARTCRSASARTCHTCQVGPAAARSPSGSGRRKVASSFSETAAVPASRPARRRLARRAALRRSVRAASNVVDRPVQLAGDRAAARLRPATLARCSASERGSCLASRVSRVACWASSRASHGGRWPAVLGLERDRQRGSAGVDARPAVATTLGQFLRALRRSRGPAVCPAAAPAGVGAVG